MADGGVIVADIVHTFSEAFHEYTVRAYAEMRGNVWIGWLEFQPKRGGRTLKTGEETSQPSKDDVAYWASGVEKVYLEGALERAK